MQAMNMIHSKYIRDIVMLLLREDEHRVLQRQVGYVEEKDFNYTASGVFVSFKPQEKALDYRFPAEHLRLNGVLIKSDEIDIAADASVIINHGIIDYLEIWSYGDIYPQKDPQHYILELQVGYSL